MSHFQIWVQLIKRMMESGFEPGPSGCLWNHSPMVSERILYGNSFLLRWQLLVMCEVSRILNKETKDRPFDTCLTSCTPVAEPTSPKILHNSEKYSLSLSEGPHASFLGSIWATHFEMQVALGFFSLSCLFDPSLPFLFMLTVHLII